MENITKEEALRFHVALWDWLSENPNPDILPFARKFEWPGWGELGGWDSPLELSPVANACFACEYVHKNIGYGDECAPCCIIPAFREFSSTCEEDGSPYELWANSKCEKEISLHAKTIADSGREALKEIEGGREK